MAEDSGDGTPSWQTRQRAELDLLQAMYPDRIQYHSQRQELTYTSTSNASLTLRLPDRYPELGYPTLLAASESNRFDLRDEIRKAVDALNLLEGEEMLDAIIQCYEDVLSDHIRKASKPQGVDRSKLETESYKTVIIWLHHLLNTNKRKLATSPSLQAAEIVGLTKPGYPGVLVYSGKAGAVDEHVAELKAQRWQAFQVRYEMVVDKPWRFISGSGISEVESMADITATIEGKAEREEFLKAMNIK